MAMLLVQDQGLVYAAHTDNFFEINIQIPYSGNFSRTINFTVFVDFTAISKNNPQKSYYIGNDSLVNS